jgi:WD40 repeat protein
MEFKFSLIEHTRDATLFVYLVNELLLASGSADKNIKIWNLLSFSLIASLHEHGFPISCSEFSLS